jgi:hypothetical protein
MLLLTATTDKLQVITGAALATDVHASFMDYASGSVTPGRQNTAISTATTTDVVAAPGASTTRNIKELHIRNKSGSSQTVTVQFNQNATVFELHQATLKAGEELQYLDGVGFVIVAASATILEGANTADVTLNAADTYLSDVALNVGGRIKTGSFFRYQFYFTKTAAGIATPIINVRFGTAGAVGDTARATFTGGAQSAATDDAWLDIEVVVRTYGASGIIQATATFGHKGTTTGFSTSAQPQFFQATSAAFDLTVANLIMGVSINPGAAGVWTGKTLTVAGFNLV